MKKWNIVFNNKKNRYIKQKFFFQMPTHKNYLVVDQFLYKTT